MIMEITAVMQAAATTTMIICVIENSPSRILGFRPLSSSSGVSIGGMASANHSRPLYFVRSTIMGAVLLSL